MQNGIAPQLDGDRSGEIQISSRQLRDGIVIGVCGEIDLATAPVVEQELLRAEESHDLVALDLSQTSFMDSTGLHLVIATHRRLRDRGGRLVVVQGPPPIRRLFKLTRVADHVELVHDASDLERTASGQAQMELSDNGQRR